MTNTSWEGDPRKKDVMAWSCHENGWSTHSKTSAALGSCGIQVKTWQAKDELERCGKEGPPENGINLGRGWDISSSWRHRVALCIGDAGWRPRSSSIVYYLLVLNIFRARPLWPLWLCLTNPRTSQLTKMFDGKFRVGLYNQTSQCKFW